MRSYQQLVVLFFWKPIRMLFFPVLFFINQHVFAAGNSLTVSLRGTNLSFQEVFYEIKKQTGLGFLYKDGIFLGANKVSLDVRNKSLLEVLALCFVNQPFEYEIFDSVVVVKPKQTPLMKNQDASAALAFYAKPPVVISTVVIICLVYCFYVRKRELGKQQKLQQAQHETMLKVKEIMDMFNKSQTVSGQARKSIQAKLNKLNSRLVTDQQNAKSAARTWSVKRILENIVLVYHLIHLMIWVGVF